MGDDRAIAAAVDATPAMAKMAAYERKEVLEFCVAEFKKRREELAMSLCVEAGKPIKVATDLVYWKFRGVCKIGPQQAPATAFEKTGCCACRACQSGKVSQTNQTLWA